MTRTFTLDELDALIAEATPGPWRGDRNDGTVKYAILAGEHEEPIVVLSVDHKSGTHGFGCGYGDEDETRYATDPQADERLVLAAPDLAAFARGLLTERDALRERLSRVWAMTSSFAHGEDCPAQYRDNPDDPGSDTSDGDGPVECECGMDDLWAVLDVREALPDTRPPLADVWTRNKALAAEREALRATVDRLRSVVEALADGCDDEYAGECAAMDHVFGLFNADRDPLNALVDEDDLATALRAMLADAPAPERPRPALVWERRSDGRIALRPANPDAVAIGVPVTARDAESVRDAALAAGFDVPEVPDV